MSFKGSEVIARPFLEWKADDVTKWLTTLVLAKDYSAQFIDNAITGKALLKLTPGSLEDMGISDVGDRVKILQQVTTMRADLVTSPPSSTARRTSIPRRGRRYSEMTAPQFHSRTHAPFRHSSSSASLSLRMSSPTKYATLDGPITFPQTSPCSMHSDYESPGSSRMSSPVKLSAASSPMDPQLHFILETDEGIGRSVHSTTTLRSHNRMLSRSVDGLLQECEDHYPIPGLNRHNSESSRLVQILREENSTLKKELEVYYQRVRRLQKLEHEVEKVRETCRTLEATTARKEKVETAMRARLEKELRRTKEVNVKQKAELMALRRQKQAGTSTQEDIVTKGELKRRDTMIRQLIRHNSDAAVVRERLENDLNSTKAALRKTVREREDGHEDDDSVVDTFHEERMHPELEAKASSMYTESIEKLKAVLSAMQNMSEKRGKLEKRLRHQLETEIRTLRGKSAEDRGPPGDEPSQKAWEQEARIAALEADVAKWEQKCLELVADKEMALETAIIPRDTRISLLEHGLTEREDSIRELKHQRRKYTKQLAETNRRIAELETRMTSLQSTVKEKESLLQMLQQSFLEPEEYSSPDQDPPYHGQMPPMRTHKHMPGSHLHLTNGAPAKPGSVGIAVGEAPAHYPGSPSFKPRQELPNGTHHSPGGLLGSPTKQHQQVDAVVMPLPPPYHYSGSPPSAFNFNVPHYSSAVVVGAIGSAPQHVRSAPNTPRMRSKPKVSPYSRLAVATDVSVCSAPGSIASSPHTPKRLQGMKSKTPPPNYKISQQHAVVHHREKRRSVDGLLDAGGESPENPRNSSIELFESLISHVKCNGHMIPPGSPVIRANYTHQHSKSSPSNSLKINL